MNIVADRPITDDIQADAAEILTVVSCCKSLGVLPRVGGLLDQDSLFVYVLAYIESANAERVELDRQRREGQASRGRKH